ncbi:hypothetical protein SEPCBS119000_005089 [Sporothrix epigloea]|uniref:DNA replication checkpoint mediator MRC1 domain-containing protein n=1 Tax=Sporothrix epigloea TaxID=1892477 RepID=A0ABP0DZG8_9PEZI
MAHFSRTPSPGAGAESESDSVVATPVTPRTKLRQLFATVGGGEDSSSDSNREHLSADEIITPSRKTARKNAGIAHRTSPALGTTASAENTPQRTSPAVRLPSTSSRVGTGGLQSSSEEDSDIEVRPRGRFAARMQAAAIAAARISTTTINTNSTGATSQTEIARERVKRILSQQATEAEKEQVDGDTNNDAGDEEDGATLPAAPRPRKKLTNLRSLRHSPAISPQLSPAATSRTVKRADSPSISMTPSKHDEREASPNMFMTPQKTDAHDDHSEVARRTKPSHNARFNALVARKREEAQARKEAEERKQAARMAGLAKYDDNVDNADADSNSEASIGGLDVDDDLLIRDADAKDDNPSDITDDEGGQKLTQAFAKSRPERKASKKALEEMHRETQRMSRNLQLTHDSRTRKRVTKDSLFDLFNFLPTSAAATIPKTKVSSNSSRPTSPASPQNNTDIEMRTADTPPSSPPVPVMMNVADKIVLATTEVEETATAVFRLDKGKQKATESLTMLETQQQPRPVRIRVPMVQNKLVMIDSDDDAELEVMQNSKRKLDVLFDNAPLKHNTEPRSTLILRRLAQVVSPGKPATARPTSRNVKCASAAADLTLAELQQSLQERARLQAKRDRDERLDMLRAKGVHVQTEEEREKEMMEVDDIVACARLEAEKLMQREREEAKKDKRNKGDGGEMNADPLDWDDSEDEDYEEEQEEDDGDDQEERDIELSGSEDENSVAGEDGDEDVIAGTLIDGKAESAHGDLQDENDNLVADENAAAAARTPATTRTRPTKRRSALIISDDEDDNGNDSSINGNTATPNITATLPALEAKTPGPKMAHTETPARPRFSVASDSPKAPMSVLRSATKPFIPGLPVAVGGAAGLGLTQIFAGTMADDSQMMAGSPSQLMSTLGNLAGAETSQAPAVDLAAVPDSQLTQAWIKRMQGGDAGTDAIKDQDDTNPEANSTTDASQLVQFSFSQSQSRGLDSLLQEQSQLTDLYYPSQDVGPREYTPLKVRFIDHQPSTMETVILGQPSYQPLLATQMSTQTSQAVPSPPPAAPRHSRGRLVRKSDVAKIAEEEENREDDADEDADTEEKAEAVSAFAKLKQAAVQKGYDRKKSKAKEMIEEQAEESEDEYAGLGGADGEESDDESLASVQDMIDDQRISSADGAKLAAFYADRERENDEKQVEKLFRDVTTGMLRRKRGAGGAGDYDLSDSDDGGEARRRMKRRQFARMQKALFADERVSKVASNPRNQAFLRTIEDRGSDDEMESIVDHATDENAMMSTATPVEATSASEAALVETSTSIPDSQPSSSTGAQQLQQPHTNLRRRRLSATNSKKPANLGEIRESLSSLLDDHHNDGSNLSTVADSEFGSDDEEDQAVANKENEALVSVNTAVPHVPAVRRTAYRHNVQVVDRVNLKRSDSTTSTGTSFEAASRTSLKAAPLGGAEPYMGPAGFRVPALLRRATTNSLISSSSSSANSSRTGSEKVGGTLDHGKIKKNASKMSGIHSFARENERRVALVESDKRRLAKKVKSAESRSRAVGSLFGGGKFE